MDLNRKNVLVVGLGMTGLATARFLHHRGAVVTVTDMAAEENLVSSVLELHQLGIRTELGGHCRESFGSSDLIVLSPGVPHTHDFLMEAGRKGIPVIGEIELASRFIRDPIIAITGTNGKTTTTSLLGNMLAACGMRVFVGGNIGNPLIGYVDRDEKADWVVLEVSSFQLDTIDTFRPDIGILLNITADHLDRYADMAGYAASKGRIFQNQTLEDIAILNGADPWVLSEAGRIRSRKWVFNGSSTLEEGARLNGNELTLAFTSCPSLRAVFPCAQTALGSARLDLGESRLYGKHNQENICAAVMAAIAAGGDVRNIQSALNQFKGLSHRIEFVRTVNGITYVDDSKATNVDAVYRALESFQEPVILIMGGRDKGGDYGILEKAMQNHVKLLILLGEASELIAAALGNLVPTVRVSSMQAAVTNAHQAATSGDVVLLSPACSSFDMFRSYAHRGDVFQGEVNKLR
ncbi:MAG: UDP-N-acetylmuramoyl-L-alanine--D-glutamate ligase [Deltaproteobacteria bacterium]|nr:UDP-N-acetylmuramoyl-L-alanine--D-glutamate ligase [Deltaproteobacteria bacterium]